ncbi:hypothetical protein M5K25_021676 [Dendrobium thyrsiflorum]|uniref:Uncharacterized protein n=1 Tax=Dendrobium thyrsiflorum TaxID=117978 RepID=A0ABD0U4X7_DENTH
MELASEKLKMTEITSGKSKSTELARESRQRTSSRRRRRTRVREDDGDDLDDDAHHFRLQAQVLGRMSSEFGKMKNAMMSLGRRISTAEVEKTYAMTDEGRSSTAELGTELDESSSILILDSRARVERSTQTTTGSSSTRLVCTPRTNQCILKGNCPFNSKCLIWSQIEANHMATFESMISMLDVGDTWSMRGLYDYDRCGGKQCNKGIKSVVADGARRSNTTCLGKVRARNGRIEVTWVKRCAIPMARSKDVNGGRMAWMMTNDLGRPISVKANVFVTLVRTYTSSLVKRNRRELDLKYFQIQIIQNDSEENMERSSCSLIYLVRGGSRPNLTEGSLSATMGCFVQGYHVDMGFNIVGEHTSFDHDHNLMVSFSSKITRSEVPVITVYLWRHLTTKSPNRENQLAALAAPSREPFLKISSLLKFPSCCPRVTASQSCCPGRPRGPPCCPECPNSVKLLSTLIPACCQPQFKCCPGNPAAHLAVQLLGEVSTRCLTLSGHRNVLSKDSCSHQLLPKHAGRFNLGKGDLFPSLLPSSLILGCGVESQYRLKLRRRRNKNEKEKREKEVKEKRRKREGARYLCSLERTLVRFRWDGIGVSSRRRMSPGSWLEVPWRIATRHPKPSPPHLPLILQEIPAGWPHFQQTPCYLASLEVADCCPESSLGPPQALQVAVQSFLQGKAVVPVVIIAVQRIQHHFPAVPEAPAATNNCPSLWGRFNLGKVGSHNWRLPQSDLISISLGGGRSPTRRTLDYRRPPTPTTTTAASVSVSKDLLRRLPRSDLHHHMVLLPPPTIVVGEYYSDPKLSRTFPEHYRVPSREFCTFPCCQASRRIIVCCPEDFPKLSTSSSRFLVLFRHPENSYLLPGRPPYGCPHAGLLQNQPLDSGSSSSHFKSGLRT